MHQVFAIEGVFLLEVVVEVSLRCELSRAPLIFAKIRPLTRMQTHVGLQVSLFIERFAASFDWTQKVATPLMFF